MPMIFNFFYFFVSVSRLMGSSATASMNMNMGNMGALSTCGVVGDAKPMQFPLTQRRKRRVLFTQAQVRLVLLFNPFKQPPPFFSNTPRVVAMDVAVQNEQNKKKKN